jgi:hypothetical protein
MFLMALAMLLPFTAVKASVAVSAQEARTEMVKKAGSNTDVKMNKIQKSFIAKKMTKFMSKRFAKAGGGIDLQDPVEKWMWFWIFGWGAGLVLSILASAVTFGTGFSIFWGLASLLWLAGSVCLVIWLLKKFGGM